MTNDTPKKKSHLLKEYIKRIVEANLTINGEEFEVSDDVLTQIRSIVSKTTKKVEGPKEGSVGYSSWLQSLSAIDKEKADRVNKVVEESGPLQEELKSLLSTKKPQEFAKVLFRLSETPGGKVIRVPDVLSDIASLSTPTKKGGVQVGKGEIAIRFMFQDAGESGANTLFDVTINGEPWHVKSGSNEGGIRMGSARGKLFVNTKIANLLVKDEIADMAELTESSQGQLAESIVKWSNMLKEKEDQLVGTREWSKYYPYVTAPEGLYDIINKECIDASMGEAVGVVWYEEGQLFFNPRDSVSVAGITQGRIIVSSIGKDKIMNIITNAPKRKLSPAESRAKKTKKDSQKSIFDSAYNDARKSNIPNAEMAKKLLTDIGVSFEPGYVIPNDTYYEFVKFAAKKDPDWVKSVLNPSLDEI